MAVEHASQTIGFALAVWSSSVMDMMPLSGPGQVTDQL